MGVKSLFWNPRERRLRAAWRLILQFALLALFVVLLGLPAGLLLLALGIEDPDAVLMVGMALNGLVVLAAVILSMWVAARILDRRRFVEFGFRFNRGWWLDFGFGLALGALMMAGLFFFQLAAGWVIVAETLRTPGPDFPFALALLSPLILFLCVGIYEEMLSRGYILLNLAEGFNWPAVGPRLAIVLAWVLSSAAFGLAHAANPNATVVSTTFLFIAGLLLGLGFILTGQLAIPIGLHITWNFFQGNVFGFPVSGGEFSDVTFIAIEQRGPDVWTGGAFGPEGGLLGLVAMAAAAALTLLWVRVRHGRIALHTPLAEPPAPRAMGNR